MNSKNLQSPQNLQQKENGNGHPKLRKVASNLFRLEPYETYYGQTRRNGKLIRESLKTSDFDLAKRKLRDFLNRVGKTAPGLGKVTFAQILERWKEIEFNPKDLKPWSRRYRELCIEGIRREWPALWEKPVRRITKGDCADWFTRRREKISAQLLNNELGTLRMVLEFAVNEGILAVSPAASLKRARIPRVERIIPTREQFSKLVEHLRGRSNHDAADFVELLAYSGMRCHEAAAMRWREVDFAKGRFTVTGGAGGTKNRDVRVVPLFPPMRRLLERLKTERGEVSTSDRIMGIKQCHMAISGACKELGFPRFGHHSMRHFFASNAIEQGIDFKTVAAWLGHKDGGVLVAQVYGHLREEHSEAMALKMTFDATPQPENVLVFQKQGTA